MPSRFIQIQLTCADLSEARTITGGLLDKRLIACAKMLPIQAQFWWDEKIESGTEVLLLLESVRERLAQIQVSIKDMHSYDLPLIQVIDVEIPSDKAKKWIETNARG